MGGGEIETADDADADEIHAIPEPYLIIQSTNQSEISKEEKDGIVLSVSEIVVEYCKSRPTEKGNNTIPKNYFFKRNTI